MSYTAALADLKAKGVDQVVFISYNDKWVMSAWGNANGVFDDSIVGFFFPTPLPLPSFPFVELTSSRYSPATTIWPSPPSWAGSTACGPRGMPSSSTTAKSSTPTRMGRAASRSREPKECLPICSRPHEKQPARARES